jgi:GntR family transcriptional regulator/MocR family aminotransferase
MRRVYLARRDALVAALRCHLGHALSFRVPAGGMALWTRVARDVDVEGWAARARQAGVLFSTAREFAFDGRSHPFLRLGYARRSEAELRVAVRRMAAALQDNPAR